MYRYISNWDDFLPIYFEKHRNQFEAQISIFLRDYPGHILTGFWLK